MPWMFARRYKKQGAPDPNLEDFMPRRVKKEDDENGQKTLAVILKTMARNG